MGLSKLNIWVSDAGDACGTWPGRGYMTIFDCEGVLKWPCGRYLAPDGAWVPVPGAYDHLPFTCGHLQVELPPGCYHAQATILGFGTPFPLLFTTHIGIVQVCCEEDACVKLYLPTAHLGLHSALASLRAAVAAGQTRLDPAKVEEFVKQGEELLQDLPRRSSERALERLADDAAENAGKQD